MGLLLAVALLPDADQLHSPCASLTLSCLCRFRSTTCRRFRKSEAAVLERNWSTSTRS